MIGACKNSEKFTDCFYCCEESNLYFIIPGKTWVVAKLFWCNEIMEETTSRDNNKCPPAWEVVNDWMVDTMQPGDEEGNSGLYFPGRYCKTKWQLRE